MTPREIIARQLLLAAAYQPSDIAAIALDGKWRWKGALDQADAALAALKAAGYAVVPREPSETMIAAGWEHTGDPCWQENVAQAYRAMLAASEGGE